VRTGVSQYGLDVRAPLRRGMRIHWRQIVALMGILVLVLIGVVCAWKAVHPFGLKRLLFGLIVTLAPATAYAYGYFRAMPEVLRADGCPQKTSLLYRWSSFSRMTFALGIVLQFGVWTSIAAMHFRGMTLSLKRIPSMVNLFVLGTLTTRPDLCIIGAIIAGMLMTVCVVASENYLACTMGPVGSPSLPVRSNLVKRAVGWCGNLGSRVLRPKAALILGGLLLVWSLIAAMDLFEGYGFQVVTGLQDWPTAEYTLSGPALKTLNLVGRGVYMGALAIALLAMGSVAVGRLGNRLRRSYAPAFFSIVIALFGLCDLALGVARLDSTVPALLNFAVLGIVWVLPIVVWVWRAGSEKEHWNRTRVSVMILYLPVVLAGLALLPLALILVPSYAFFMVGSLFLALGFLQSRWETAQPVLHLAPEGDRA
jgi:hypothetical protein